MRIKKQTSTLLLLREGGFQARHWGILVLLLSLGAIAAIMDKGEEIPEMIIPMLIFFIASGSILTIFSRFRLKHILDKSSNEGRIEYPRMMSMRREIRPFQLSEVKALIPEQLSLFTTLAGGPRQTGFGYQVQQGFAYLLNDGTVIEAGEYTSSSKELKQEIEAVSQFLGVPIITPEEENQG